MIRVVKSLNQFKEMVENDPEIQKLLKDNPKDAMNQFKFEEPVYVRDKWIYRLVVSILGLVILVSVIGVVILMGDKAENVDKLIPTMLTAVCSAAIGALTGLLAPSPRSSTN